MAITPSVSEDPSLEKNRVKLTFEVQKSPAAKPGEGLPPKSPESAPTEPPATTRRPQAPLPDQLASPEQQAQAALQLRQVRAPALAEAREEQEEDAQLEREQIIQSAQTPERLQASGRADLEKLKQQKAGELKKAQAKYQQKTEFEKKKAEIKKKYREKAKKRAEKYAKVAKEKIEQTVGEALVTLGQEVGPVIMEIVTYICLLGLGLCGTVDWLFDAAVSVFNLGLRALTQYQRVKKALGLAEKNEGDSLFKDLTEKFLTQTVLPVVGGSIMEMVPYLDYGPWEEAGVLTSGLLIVYNLIKSYRQAKSMENEAKSMADS